MTTAPENNDLVVLPLQSGGALIISAHPASLPDATPRDAITRYTELGASALLSLTTHEELLALDLAQLPAICKEMGIKWWHAPIVDMGVPDEVFEQWWSTNQAEINKLLLDGKVLAVHCWSGVGRSGMVACRILIERGMAPQDALAHVRQFRPGAVETPEQERYVLGLTA
jgi:protein-tyrosine phosphatase